MSNEKDNDESHINGTFVMQENETDTEINKNMKNNVTNTPV